MSSALSVNVSIVIKTLNEEAHIEAAIRSALAAVEQVGGEVILADSASTDGTVEIARRFPVVIVQLENIGDRRCGAGAQLGFQAARGDFVYILDGDMELDPHFLPAALDVMHRCPGVAGVAGLVEEQYATNYQFRGRKRKNNEGTAGECKWLSMGGLYRRTALEQVGYFSNRNLHAYEEMDLGLRLTHAGWHLRRLPRCAVRHHGHTETSWTLLKRRWRSRYLDGAGEILRASLARPWFVDTVRAQRYPLVGFALWIGAIGGVLLLPRTVWVLAATAAILVLLIIWRRFRTGNIRDALFGQFVWQLEAIALMRGFLARPTDPRRPIDSITLTRSGVPADRHVPAGPSIPRRAERSSPAGGGRTDATARAIRNRAERGAERPPRR